MPLIPVLYTHSIADVSLTDPGGFLLRVQVVGNGGNLRSSLLLDLAHPCRLQSSVLLGCLLSVQSILLLVMSGRR